MTNVCVSFMINHAVSDDLDETWTKVCDLEFLLIDVLYGYHASKAAVGS